MPEAFTGWMLMLSKHQAYRNLIRPLSLLGVCLIAGFLIALFLSPAFSRKPSMDSIVDAGVFVGLGFAGFIFSPVVAYKIVFAVQTQLARLRELDEKNPGSNLVTHFQQFIISLGVGLSTVLGWLINELASKGQWHGFSSIWAIAWISSFISVLLYCTYRVMSARSARQ